MLSGRGGREDRRGFLFSLRVDQALCMLLGTCSTPELHHQEEVAFFGFQSTVLPSDPEVLLSA